MFKQRSNQKELMDDLTLDSVELIKNLHEIQVTNRWFGSRQTLISALDKIYNKHQQHIINKKLTIGDLGCGSGDLLRVTKDWAHTKKLSANLLGLDANSSITHYASKLSTHHPEISYHHVDVFDHNFKNYQFDIVTLNSFCHHLTDEELFKLLTQLQMQTRLAIVINDLHRHWLPYYGIKLFAHLLHFSTLGKHDGPTSVLRAFKKNDLINLMQTININQYDLRWTWAFRWQLIIWCEPPKEI